MGIILHQTTMTTEQTLVMPGNALNTSTGQRIYCTLQVNYNDINFVGNTEY